MKAIIFAGGVGTRLWPLSRRKSPKQFEKVVGDKSTLQLAIERLLPDFNLSDIYIATSNSYVDLVKKQLPHLDTGNIIGEPESRDVGPAVGLAILHLIKKFPKEPVLILWSDHLVQQGELFRKIIKNCAAVIRKDKNKIIFIGQKPRFASQNLGWIKFDEKVTVEKETAFHAFESFHYRPNISDAETFLKNGHYAWNVGYFVTTPAFLWDLYRRYQPVMFNLLQIIQKPHNKKAFDNRVKELYPQFEKISFDNAILEKINAKEALVISENLGWSDVGAWEALKEALQDSPDQNVINGKVMVTDCRDSLIYNYTNQMVVTIDLDGLLVINTNDVVLICHKNSVPKIKKLVEKLAGSENEHLI